jgi:hypothetical protein
MGNTTPPICLGTHILLNLGTPTYTYSIRYYVREYYEVYDLSNLDLDRFWVI